MTVAVDPSQTKTQLLASIGVLSIATVLALISAQPFAGSWNDSSRLATVECLVDYHTMVIDDSIFVRVPVPSEPARPLPFTRDDPKLLREGSGDKLLIKGHFYSDKSPVPALFMALFYQGFKWCTGWTAREHADSFCYWMTVGSSGVAYVAAVWCIFQIGGFLGLQLPVRLALTASFGLATVALTYARHVNNHILLLALMAALLLQIIRLNAALSRGPLTWWGLLGLGTLAGLAYTVDLGAGPVILMCTLALVAYRWHRLTPVVMMVLGAVPWLALHHAVNYGVGGTFKPANAVPEYFNWPGCVFNTQNMTGAWNHQSIGHFLVYAAGLLVGKRGFLDHNLALFLAVPGLVVLLLRRIAELPELSYAGCCCGGIWLAYALTSNNYSGQCCSIRWFLPLLAPAYYAIAVLIRSDRRYLATLVILSAWGVVESVFMWRNGPWSGHMVPSYWQIHGTALLTLLGYWSWNRPQNPAVSANAAEEPFRQAKAA